MVGRLILGVVDRKWEERGLALFTIFNKYAGNGFFWLADMQRLFHLLLKVCLWNWRRYILSAFFQVVSVSLTNSLNP